MDVLVPFGVLYTVVYFCLDMHVAQSRKCVDLEVFHRQPCKCLHCSVVTIFRSAWLTQLPRLLISFENAVNADGVSQADWVGSKFPPFPAVC